MLFDFTKPLRFMKCCFNTRPFSMTRAVPERSSTKSRPSSSGAATSSGWMRPVAKVCNASRFRGEKTFRLGGTSVGTMEVVCASELRTLTIGAIVRNNPAARAIRKWRKRRKLRGKIGGLISLAFHMRLYRAEPHLSQVVSARDVCVAAMAERYRAMIWRNTSTDSGVKHTLTRIACGPFECSDVRPASVRGEFGPTELFGAR